MFAHIDSRAAVTAACILSATLFPIGDKNLCRAAVPNGSPAYSIRPTEGGKINQLSALPQNLITHLPDAFDLHDEGRAAPARADDSCASCWSSAATYVVESLLMPEEEVDLSETHMQMVQTRSCQAGASVEMAMGYLVSWNGPIAESDYTQLVLKQGLKAQERTHVRQVRYLPPRQGPLDNFSIKYAIYHYGPLYASVGWRGITNPTYHTYYWPGNSPVHAAALVGWDDQFPRDQFTTSYQGTTDTPPGDGAFIAKNNDGSFYHISYYDGTVGYNDVATFAVEPLSNHQHIYQHDPYGTRSWIGPHKIPGNDANNGDHFVPAIFGANVFTALEAGTLSTIGFYVQPHMLPAGEQAIFEVAIHLDPDWGPVNSAGAALDFTTRVSLGGYHSIALPTEIPLSANQRFSVVLRGYSTTGTQNAIHLPVERMPYSEPFAVNPGESFVSKDGSSWFDLTEVPDTNSETGAMEHVYGNLGVKAYTKTPDKAPTIISGGQSKRPLLKPETLDLTLLKPRRALYSFGAPPLLVSTNPLPNYTVATEYPEISAQFQDEIKPGPGLAQITLSSFDETRQVYASVQGDTLSIFPVGPFGDAGLGGKEWTVKIPADAVTDLYGNPMEQPYSWSFWVIGVN